MPASLCAGPASLCATVGALPIVGALCTVSGSCTVGALCAVGALPNLGTLCAVHALLHTRAGALLPPFTTMRALLRAHVSIADEGIPSATISNLVCTHAGTLMPPCTAVLHARCASRRCIPSSAILHATPIYCS
eukprot:scaffold33962_cov17-Tisochrysis_lutea.AAC.1